MDNISSVAAKEAGSEGRQHRKHSREYKITVASKFESLAKIGSFLSQTGTQLGLPADFLFDVQTAVNEACTNIIQHAYAMRSDRPVVVGCRFRNRELILRIRHFGEAFVPESVPAPKIKDDFFLRRRGGLGMFMMKKLMNRVKYKFDDKRGSEILMAKRLPDPEANETLASSAATSE